MGLSNLSTDYLRMVENILEQDISSVFREIKKITTENVA